MLQSLPWPLLPGKRGTESPLSHTQSGGTAINTAVTRQSKAESHSNGLKLRVTYFGRLESPSRELQREVFALQHPLGTVA